MRPVLCVFAHPDDEAFGPGGTITILAQTRDVHLVCVTNGDAGQNSCEDARELATVRREELERSAKILGVKRIYFFDYRDGNICNNEYHEIADKITTIAETVQPEILLTFDQKGVSGHIDHIAVSMITTYVFEKLPFVKKLMYYGVSEEYSKLHTGYFIYFPQGHKRSEIDEIVDVSPVWETKVAGMREHASQKHDCDKILERYEKLGIKEEYFLIREK